jgi:hypothetical protein
MRNRFTRLKTALFGRTVGVGLPSTLVYAVALVAIAWFGIRSWRQVLHTPPAGPTMARAMDLLAMPKLGFRPALDVTWEREMRFAASLPRTRLNLLVPRVPAALCPPVAVGAAATMQRSLTTELETALEARASDPQAARAALEALRGARPDGRLGEVLRDYNLARAHLILGDTATAARLLLPHFADDTSSRRDALADEVPILGYHARLLAGISLYPLRDSLAVSQFRGAVRALQRLAPGEYVGGSRRQATYHAFTAPLGAYACGGDPGPGTGSMEAWVGLVRAYRQAEGYRDTYNLPGELERTRGAEYPSDPLVPLLRHGRRVAVGGSSPIPESYFWAASNLQRIYDYNRLDPDPRLELARAELLLIVAADSQWTAAVAAAAPFDRCRVVDGLAAEFGRSAPVTQTPVATDSMRAAVALLANARRAGCAQAGEREIDAPLRSEFLVLGAGLLGDSVAARAEAWRRSLEGGDSTRAGGEGGSAAVLAEAERLTARLAPGRMKRLFPGADTAYRFLHRWRSAVFGEVADSLRARAASGGLANAATDSLPDVLLAAARLSGRPGVVDPAELRRRGAPIPLTYLARVTAANHPVVMAAAVVAITLSLLALATWTHLAVWRRRLLLSTRLYLDDRPTELPFGGG